MRKSIFVLNSCVNYLGLTVNLVKQSISIPPTKSARLNQIVHWIADAPLVSKRATACLNGYFLFILQALCLPNSPLNTAGPHNIAAILNHT